MGIDNAAAKMLLLLRNEPGVDFSKTIILGRQHNYIGPVLRRAVQSNFKLSRKSLPLESEYADEFLETLGISNPSILDASDYEGASILHDLNKPIPSSLKCQFSTVIDIGSIEHVYNVPQAIQNLKDLCAVDGLILIVSPSNNWLGHGFYQFSPEFFFRTFDAPSGFEIRKLFLIKLKFTGNIWYSLIDPKILGRRGTIVSRRRCLIAVIATKVSASTTGLQPQQSDYESVWESRSISRLGALYLSLPWILRKSIELTLIPAKTRFANRNRMARVRFGWRNGCLVLKNFKLFLG